MRKLRLSLFFLIYYSLSFGNTVIVTNTNSGGLGSLKYTIEFIAAEGDTVKLSPSLIASGNDTIVILSPINITKNLVIKGLISATDTLFISGNNANQIFNVQIFSSPTIGHVEFDSLVIIDGGGARGGAIFTYESISVKNCVFQSNAAVFEGGVVYFKKNIELVNTKFIKNEAGKGGVLYSEYINVAGSIFPDSAEITINNCEFLDNEAADNGGAIFLNHRKIKFEIDNSIFLNNISQNNGGAIFINLTYTDERGFIKIKNSQLINNSATAKGGAIFVHSITIPVEVYKCVFEFNSADEGGAIYKEFFTIGYTSAISRLDNRRLIVENSTFTDNTAVGVGGAIYSFVSILGVKNRVIVKNSDFTDNSAGDNGGAFHLLSYEYNGLEMENCELKRNSSGNNGGAISFVGKNNVTSILNSTIRENSAINNGGGIYSYGWNVADTTQSIIGILNSTIAQNKSSNGGGIYSETKTNAAYNKNSIAINKSTLSRNTASQKGGGIYVVNGNSTSSFTIVDIVNSTFYMNKASLEGGTIYSFSLSPVSDQKIYTRSSILFTNLPNAITKSTSGNTIISQGYNIFNQSLLPGNISTDQTNIDSTLLDLGPLLMNTGITPTHLPNPASVAIDNGTPGDVSNAQNGVILGSSRDVGSAEYGNFVDLPENDLNLTVSCYPNPNNGNFTVKLTDNVRFDKISIYTIQGKMVKEISPQSTLINLNIDGPKGIYILVVTTENAIITERIIKQ